MAAAVEEGVRHLPERLRVAAGQTIYRVGDTGDLAFLLLGGTVELRGFARPLLRVSGDIFGELALIDDGGRDATAVAVSDCDLLAFSVAELSPGVEQLGPLLRMVMGSLAARQSELVSERRRAAGQSADPLIRPMWTDGRAAARSIVAFEHELRTGLAGDELELFFQPIVQLETARLAGFEALARWRHPARGLLLPGDFIPLAEAAGLMGEVTTFCLREVGRRFPALQSAGRLNSRAVDRLFVSVNVSASDLAQPAFAARTVTLLSEGGVEPEDVRLEVTESVLMTDIDRCAQTLRNCRDQGFLIAIDDFGTGYSSLHMLNALPLSVLKMDRSFCASSSASEAGRKVIAAILRLGHELDLQVIAEGIETQQQAALLKTMDCDFGQGFLFGGPLDIAAACRAAAGEGAAVAPAA